MGFVNRLTGVIIPVMILVGLCTQAQGQTRADQTLIVGTKVAPPFAMRDSEGTWIGVSIDLWRQIATELDLPFEFREVEVQSLIMGLLTALWTSPLQHCQ